MRIGPFKGISSQQAGLFRGLAAASLIMLGAAPGCSDDDGGGSESGTESGTESGNESGQESGNEAGQESGQESGNESGQESGEEGPGGETTSVRVIHLSPDAPAVDVFVNRGDEAAVSELAFPNATGYLTIPAGTYTFDVAPTGGTADDSVLTVADIPLMANTNYTVAAIGNVADIQALPLTDDYSNVPAGQIRIRAAHTAAAVGQVDIWNITDINNPSMLFENVDFGIATSYVEIPAQAYVLGVDVDNDAVPDLLFNVPSLPAGTVATAFAANDAEGNVFLLGVTRETTVRIDAEVFVPPAANAKLRLAHLSPDAPAVDIYANGVVLAANVSFPEASPSIDVPAGTYDLAVTAAGGSIDDAVLAVDGIPFEGGKAYTAYAWDSVSQIKAGLISDDFSDIAANQVRVRFVHAAVGIGQVDVWDISDSMNPAPLFVDVDFGAAIEPVLLPVAIYTIGVDVDNDAIPDVVFSVPAAAGAGTLVNLFALTDAEGTPFLGAQLGDAMIPLAAIVPEASNADVRVLHLSPDAPAVDVFVNGVASGISNIAFTEGTPYVALPAGSYDFAVSATGAPVEDAVLSVQDIPLMASSSYTVVAYDVLASISPLLLEDERSLNITTNQAWVRAVHAAPAVGQVDIWNIPSEGEPSALLTDVDFGVASTYLPLDPAAYVLGVDANDDGSPDLVFELPGIMAGDVITLFATNTSGGDVFLLAQFEDGTTAAIYPAN